MFSSRISIGKKIGAGFFVVLGLLIVSSIISYLALTNAASGFVEYRTMAKATNLAGRLQANTLMSMLHVKDFILTGNEQSMANYQKRSAEMEQFLTESKREITAPELTPMIREIDEGHDEYKEAFSQVQDDIRETNKAYDEIFAIQGPIMEQKLTEIMSIAKESGDAGSIFSAGLAMRDMLLGRLYMTKYLVKHDRESMDRVRTEFGNMGKQVAALETALTDSRSKALLTEARKAEDLYVSTAELQASKIANRDELIKNTLDTIGPKVADDAEKIKLSIKDVQDQLGPRLVQESRRDILIITITGIIATLFGAVCASLIGRHITRSITLVANGLDASANQVNAAAGEIASSSQSLAEGATEQASSLEETSASMEEMSSMTRQNSDNAREADSLMHASMSVIQQAAESMEEMGRSMNEIAEASAATSKIIKTIDEIAFQTNLLALNAAVEAARAGEAGAGFAVVAEEVRNLAMRSTEAAKNTASLIEGTVTKVNGGKDVVETATSAFRNVEESSTRVASLISEIATASKEQAIGFGQINQAITQMEAVTQQNSAASEQSAAAAAELSSQSASMMEMVREMLAFVHGGGKASADSALAGSARNSQAKRLPPAPRQTARTRIPVPRPATKEILALEAEENFASF